MAGEKTEKATPKKRKDSREKEGNVLQSKEVTTTVSILGMFIILSLFAKFSLQQLMNSLEFWISIINVEGVLGQREMTQNSVEIIKTCIFTIAPLALAAGVLGIIPVIVQTKGLFNMKSLAPKFSKLNPITGIKRLFSMQSVVNIIKGLIEIAAVVVIVYNKLMSLMNQIKKLPDMELKQGIVFTAETVFDVVMLICIVFIFVSAGDYIFQWWSYEKKLRMSKQEIKDEYKNIEGDPKIKGKIKQKQREIAQNRMMQDVPQSDVVIRNPTHYAVALRYDTENANAAPVVIAKGMDLLALRIIEIAQENNVYIKEDRPLARTLYEVVEIGGEIPYNLYSAIATVLSEMYEAKGINPKLSNKKATI